ncbi:hypothetical protein GCM10009530_11970 [Microbispora corallina]|uniref:Uncharacterized protein n=1 Tax=Microbispora corallina TaxID=83302 RepID=A0ABQ4FTK5_9ACTN|nr:hypothetical protein [Microbispora corallina]GIH38106.1 hypothetical protein Mco01_11060 [Microbispora corallina]
MGALGALLERSLVQIAEASADARLYDRRTIHTVSDVWDNNTFPLFHAATALTFVGRARRARAALAWMADLGSERRSWMVEQATVAGHKMQRLLPPPPAEPPHVRDHRGRVRPSSTPLTAEAALALGTDYDLGAAEVRTLLLERVGTRLTGSVVLAAPRRYDAGLPAGEPPELYLWLKDVTDADFDSDDRMGVAIDSGTEGITISVGASGRLRATSGTAYPDDRAWHRSTAGRAADQRTPPREEHASRAPERRRPQPQGAVLVAARILHSVMLEIRMVRYAHLADRIPVRLLASALDGAGTDILAAGARRGSRREKAFRSLVENWIKNGDPALTPWFTDQLRLIMREERLPDTTKAWIEGIIAPGAALPHLDAAAALDLALEGDLRFAKYTAAHSRYEIPRDSSAVVVLAHPPTEQDSPNQPWRLRTLKVDDVSRFQLRTDAFDGPLGLRTTGETSRVESLVLGRDALDVCGRKAQP